MRILLLIGSAAIAALAPHSGFVQTVNANSASQTEEQRVLAAEDEYVAAEVRRDEAALRRMVDDRFVFNSSDGSTLDKEGLIQSVLRMNMVAQTIRERSVLLEGNMALIFGTADLHFASPGKPETVSSLRYTSAYVRRDGQWRMLALQMQQRAEE